MVFPREPRWGLVIIHYRISQKLRQIEVLVLEVLQLAGVHGLHPAELGSPLVERGVADAVLAYTSAADSPAWCSFNIPMICSYVNLS